MALSSFQYSACRLRELSAREKSQTKPYFLASITDEEAGGVEWFRIFFMESYPKTNWNRSCGRMRRFQCSIKASKARRDRDEREVQGGNKFIMGRQNVRKCLMLYGVVMRIDRLLSQARVRWFSRRKRDSDGAGHMYTRL
jgi:hypothetical protein